MNRAIRTFHAVSELLRTGNPRLLARVIRRRIHSENHAIVFRRDLDRRFDPPPLPVRLTVRALRADDVDSLLDPAADGHPGDDRDRVLRRRMLRIAKHRCLVAQTANGAVCYMQWLFTWQDNDALRAIFGNSSPHLGRDTVLLEAAYTPGRYRRLPFMPTAMAMIAAKGRDVGARWAIVFVDEEHASMRKACTLAGFEPYVRRTERWRMFRRTSTLGPLTQQQAGLSGRPG